MKACVLGLNVKLIYLIYSEVIFMTSREILLGYCLKYHNDWQKIYDGMVNNNNLAELEELVSNFNGNYISYFDNEYPLVLKQAYHPPFVLYYEGDISALQTKNLIFLHGDNIFNLPTDRLITISGEKIKVGNNLKIWFTNPNDFPEADRRTAQCSKWYIASHLCSSLLCTKIIREHSNFDLFIALSVNSALNAGKNVGFVPTSGPSENNQWIKQGAYLIDCAHDVFELDQ